MRLALNAGWGARSPWLRNPADSGYLKVDEG
jgi:hypothetical protein